MGQPSDVKAEAVQVTEREIADDSTPMNETTRMRWEDRIEMASRVRRVGPEDLKEQTEHLPSWLSGEGSRPRWQERVATAVQMHYTKSADKTTTDEK